MKKWIHKTAIFITMVCICVGFSIPSYAAGMSVSVDDTKVTQGETVSFTVSFEGSNLSYAFIEASGDGAVIGNMKEMFGDDSSYQSRLSKTFSLFASGSGNGTIHVTGYVGYLDENGNPQDSEFYSQSVSVNVIPKEDGAVSPMRGASPDGDYLNSDGSPINGRPVEEAVNVDNNPQKEDKNKTSGKGEQSSKPLEKETTASKSDSNTDGSKGIWIWLASGVVVVFAAVVIAVLLIRKRNEMLIDQETSDDKDSEDDNFSD